MPSTTAPLSRLSGHVVAGLVDNGLAAAVARAAVEEATARHAKITFLHVVPDGLSSADHAVAAATMFRTVLRANGAGAVAVACTFETVSGDAAEALVDSCEDAGVLVVGADDLDVTNHVADYCTEHCACPVRVVTDPDRTGPPRAAGSAPSPTTRATARKA
ncbi:hypothetical protein [Lapillicoccus sp.]|uniref:hypothetical protein n=1 Tax=Lapillicoccus sp. TaxID=1909287 RepID=UPI0025FD59BB|nr:hypothetical protein [Lapillicoccus sp.]